jgi:voltage-dependent calcium channel L type alpha-1D
VIGPKTYLHDAWNCLDFVIVFFSVVNWIMDAAGLQDISFVKGFRALRALRPLRMVSKNEGIKTVVNSLLLSIPTLLNVMLIILLFLLVFGILGVQMFKGSMGVCNDKSEAIQMRDDCSGNYTVTKLDKWGDPDGTLDIARVWSIPTTNYDNVFNSMLSFFEICSLEMWPSIMHRAIDAQGEDMVPSRNHNPAISLLFIIYIFLTTFFIMNLFISVIVDKFNEEIKKRQGAHNFTDEQKEWVKIQRLLVHTNPKIIPVEPSNCFRVRCFNVV